MAKEKADWFIDEMFNGAERDIDDIWKLILPLTKEERGLALRGLAVGIQVMRDKQEELYREINHREGVIADLCGALKLVEGGE